MKMNCFFIVIYRRILICFCFHVIFFGLNLAFADIDFSASDVFVLDSSQKYFGNLNLGSEIITLKSKNQPLLVRALHVQVVQTNNGHERMAKFYTHDDVQSGLNLAKLLESNLKYSGNYGNVPSDFTKSPIVNYFASYYKNAKSGEVVFIFVMEKLKFSISSIISAKKMSGYLYDKQIAKFQSLFDLIWNISVTLLNKIDILNKSGLVHVDINHDNIMLTKSNDIVFVDLNSIVSQKEASLNVLSDIHLLAMCNPMWQTSFHSKFKYNSHIKNKYFGLMMLQSWAMIMAPMILGENHIVNLSDIVDLKSAIDEESHIIQLDKMFDFWHTDKYFPKFFEQFENKFVQFESELERTVGQTVWYRDRQVRFRFLKDIILAAMMKSPSDILRRLINITYNSKDKIIVKKVLTSLVSNIKDEADMKSTVMINRASVLDKQHLKLCVRLF